MHNFNNSSWSLHAGILAFIDICFDVNADSLNSFKKHLKTYLFYQAFSWFITRSVSNFFFPWYCKAWYCKAPKTVNDIDAIYIKFIIIIMAKCNITPAFSVTCRGDIFVRLSTCHLSTCYWNSCLTVDRQFFILLAEEMTNKWHLLISHSWRSLWTLHVSRFTR